MEETIRTESGGAGWLLTKQAAEGILVILLGAALLISQVFSSMPENRMGEEQFRNADIVGSKLHAWNPDSSNGLEILRIAVHWRSRLYREIRQASAMRRSR